MGARHEVGFVNSEAGIEVTDMGNGRLAHPDRADGLGFDQFYANPAGRETVGERRGAHPAGGSAADNQDVIDLIV